MRPCVLVLVAACYSPRVPSAVPCGDGVPRCPSGQVCVNDVCYRPDEVPIDTANVPVDAEIDGSPFVDTDMDGVVDSVDNCRTKANVDQANEDADNLGDICDPCPISTTNTDGDADGVGDACDPHPNTAGDKVLLFEPFNTMPAGWFASGGGTWSVTGGALVVTVPPNAFASMSAPVTPDASGMLITSGTVTALPDTPAGIGIALPMGQNGFAGVVCAIFDEAGDRRFGLYDIQTDNIFESTSKSWSIGDAYEFRIRRTGEQFRCTVGGEIQEDNQTPMPLLPKVGLRTQSANASFAYLMYVDSP